MISKNFIRFITKFEVEPAKLSVVATDDQVVPGWMNVHRGNPPYSRNKHFQELLLCKVIDPNIALRRHKKMRLGRVEQNELDRALDLLEWSLGMSA